MPEYHALLQPDLFYHVFSRATGSEKLFLEADNYRYFLEKYIHHISPVAKTYAYCLLPNHFHFLIQIRPTEKLEIRYQQIKNTTLINPAQIPDFLMEQFSNWLNGYTKAFNKKYNRRGSLFMDYMQRRLLSDESERFIALYYIHNNPVKHEICFRPEQWQWSSYLKCTERSHQFDLKETLSWFGSVNDYIHAHKTYKVLKTL